MDLETLISEQRAEQEADRTPVEGWRYSHGDDPEHATVGTLPEGDQTAADADHGPGGLLADQGGFTVTSAPKPDAEILGVCPVCDRPLPERKPGQRGRPAKYHPECKAEGAAKRARKSEGTTGVLQLLETTEEQRHEQLWSRQQGAGRGPAPLGRVRSSRGIKGRPGVVPPRPSRRWDDPAHVEFHARFTGKCPRCLDHAIFCRCQEFSG